MSAALTVTDRIAPAMVGLEPESATTLRAVFESMFSQADEWVARAKSINVTSVDQRREMKLARESRLALREIRVNADRARKRLKEDSVRQGRAIDGIANVLKALIEPIEEHLLVQEQFADRAEEARKDTLRAARSEALLAYGADPAVFANLGETDESTWASILDGARAAHDAKIEAAKHAELVRVEAERIAAERREAEKAARAKAEAERVERERFQSAENARLRSEAVERESAARLEREAAAKARDAAEAQAEAAAAKTRAAQAEAERVAGELAAERAAAAKVEEDRAAAERARRAADEAAELAPDREKLHAFAAALRALQVPTCTTSAGKAAAKKVAEQLEKMAGWVSKTSISL